MTWRILNITLAVLAALEGDDRPDSLRSPHPDNQPSSIAPRA
jgi:hypothetical protein